MCSSDLDVLALADQGPWLYTVMEEVKLEPPWYKNRVVLVGDAAHAACPFWAQGAAMALEDVILLARLLGDSQTLEGALSHWMTRRYPRCKYVQDGSLETGILTHQDEESDAPKKFPAPAKAGIEKQFHAREKIMGEPF